MKATEAPGETKLAHRTTPDDEILELFYQDTGRAWQLFIGKYADVIFSHLRRLGFDYDQAMDRFVYICEKLSEQELRRLRTIRYTGGRDLTPWVRKVVTNLSTNWVWSVEGRKRLLKPIARLPAVEQRIFELYFWRGLSPSAIHEQLQLEHFDISFIETLDAVERIFTLLSRKKLWRLLSSLAKSRGEISLDDMGEGVAFEPVGREPSPEEILIQKEAEEQMRERLLALAPRERLVVQLRYEECLSPGEVAEMLSVSEREVKRALKAAMRKLRRGAK
jgi:DNA-directed RNA polymerase specialized sigma subunit